MPYEHHGPAAVAPRREQRSDVVLALRVVARPPVMLVVESALHVDHQQREPVQIRKVSDRKLHRRHCPLCSYERQTRR